MNRIWFTAILFLSLAACSNNQEDKSDSKVTDNHITQAIDSSKANKEGMESEGTTVQTSDEIPAAEKIDFTRPEIVVQQMVKYAQQNNYNGLKALCSQEALQQNDPQSICNGNQQLFAKLAKAKIPADNINVKGNIATVPIVLDDNGKTGTQKTMVRLVMKDGKWYIAQIENLNLNNQ